MLWRLCSTYNSLQQHYKKKHIQVYLHVLTDRHKQRERETDVTRTIKSINVIIFRCHTHGRQKSLTSLWFKALASCLELCIHVGSLFYSSHKDTICAFRTFSISVLPNIRDNYISTLSLSIYKLLNKCDVQTGISCRLTTHFYWSLGIQHFNSRFHGHFHLIFILSSRFFPYQFLPIIPCSDEMPVWFPKWHPTPTQL